MLLPTPDVLPYISFISSNNAYSRDETARHIQPTRPQSWAPRPREAPPWRAASRWVRVPLSEKAPCENALRPGGSTLIGRASASVRRLVVGYQRSPRDLVVLHGGKRTEIGGFYWHIVPRTQTASIFTRFQHHVTYTSYMRASWVRWQSNLVHMAVSGTPNIYDCALVVPHIGPQGHPGRHGVCCVAK